MNRPVSAGRLPLLLALFVSTGCASLIYEIVWFQLLQLVIGSSAVSLGLLLGTFMGGMCLGSLLLPRWVPATVHPLRVYAMLELGIGVCGIAALYAMPAIDQAYSAVGGVGIGGIALRAVVCASCLLVPTFLMGASLPAISRWIEATPSGVSWLGLFYGGNIAGAVVGCLLAGFWLLRLYDAATASYFAAAINATAALVSLLLAKITPYEAADGAEVPIAIGSAPVAIYAAIAISGFCALGAEVIWTRLLSLILGGTVYTFSIILAVFLFGLGLGSSVASVVARVTERPRLALAVCQALLGLAIAWTAWMLSQSLPYWPVSPSLAKSPWFNFQIDLVRCLWAILPATILWGASFPLALAAAASRGQDPTPETEPRPSGSGFLAATASRGQDPARMVGRMYAANTAGAIAGALGASMILIPWIGTQRTQQLLIALSVGAAATLAGKYGRRWVMTPVAMAYAALLAWAVVPTPWQLVAYGRKMLTTTDGRALVFSAEGMNASIAVTKLVNSRFFHVSGKVEASSQSEDMRLQGMLGHLPALLHPDPRNVLVVGFGAGVTAGSFLRHPSVTKLVVCEIEPLIPRMVAPHFAAENHDVLKDPRTEMVYDDGRHYVLTTGETFDIITSDPIHPWVKGNAALYTKEYFEYCKRRLRPGGFVTQWVPLYESDLETVRSEIATFFEVFPNGTIWGNDFDGDGYDVVLMGQVEETRVDTDRIARRFEIPGLGASLRQAGFRSPSDLLYTFAGRARDLKEWLRGAQINRDRNLRLHYLAGMGVNSNAAGFIYQEILRWRKPMDGK